MTETNHFQTIPDKLQYNPVITESNKNSVSEEKFFQKFAKSFDINKPKEFDFSNENTIHKTTDDKHRKKIFYGIFGFTFLIVMVFFVIALSYLYQSNDKNNFQKIVPKTHDDIAEILKIESKSNAKTLFDKAKQFEQDGSTLQALKNRLQGINNYIQFKEYPAALSEAEKADSLLKTQFKNDNSDIISKLRIYHYNFLVKFIIV